MNQLNKSSVAVLGAFRGGTSCVAGVLHHLGVHMGTVFKQTAPPNPKGFYEEDSLLNLCKEAYQEPWLKQLLTNEQIVARLKEWYAYQLQSTDQCRIVGGKHPTLCMMVPLLEEAWPNAHFISVTRPVEESIQSIMRLHWRWPAPIVESIIPRMVTTRDADLANIQPERVMRFPFADLCENPRQIVSDICSFLNLSTNQNNIDSAVRFVDKGLVNFRT